MSLISFLFTLGISISTALLAVLIWVGAHVADLC